jgi:hypothetical protein
LERPDHCGPLRCLAFVRSEASTGTTCHCGKFRAHRAGRQDSQTAREEVAAHSSTSTQPPLTASTPRMKLKVSRNQRRRSLSPSNGPTTLTSTPAVQTAHARNQPPPRGSKTTTRRAMPLGRPGAARVAENRRGGREIDRGRLAPASRLCHDRDRTWLRPNVIKSFRFE